MYIFGGLALHDRMKPTNVLKDSWSCKYNFQYVNMYM